MKKIEIPGFEIIEEIGAGGMATVWKARQVSLNRIVAIKILHSKFAIDPTDIQRFHNEAHAAARLKHPGIVQVYDANAIEGVYYFIMEYVAGYTVGDWIKRKGVLPVKDALLVADCVANALQYAWGEAAIIHCDVKPDNVLVDADGSVKVSDLGLARTLSHMRADAESDDIMGTPAYIAPELAIGEADADFRADIYSLGATLYHMVTGWLPFSGHTADEVLDLQVHGTVPDPCDVNPNLPPPVAWLIEKMMCKDPEGRQASWDAVRLDLERVRRGMRPVGETLPEGVSTVLRSAKRARALAPAMEYLKKPHAPLAEQILGVVALVALVFGAYFVFSAARHGKFDAWLAPYGVSLGVDQAQPVEAPVEAGVDNRWAAEYADALAWVAANPTLYDEGIAKLTGLAELAAGSPVATKAISQAAALRSQKQKRIDGVLDRLAQTADPLVADGEYESAAELYVTYAGEQTSETEVARAQRAAELRQQAQDTVPEPVRPLETVMEAVAGAVLGGRLSDAIVEVDKAATDPGLAERKAELEALRSELEGAATADQRILDSFARQKGQQITMQLRSGPRTVRVRDVRDGRVVVAVVNDPGDTTATGTIEIDVRSLKYPERRRRLSGEEFAGASLCQGLMAVEAGATETARRYFAGASPLIAEHLQSLLPAGD